MQRPGADVNLAQQWLNESMRTMLNRRNWAGSRKSVVTYFPQAYTAGTISLTTNKTTVVGTGTNWPVNDVVNTVITQDVQAPREQFVCLASMDGVTRSSIFYIDAGSVNAEIAPVLDILGNRVLLNMRYPHPNGCSVWQSSLSGQQIRPSGYTVPIYTNLAITSPTTLELDNPWAQANQSGYSYQMLQMYIPIDPNIKDIVTATDPFQNIDLRIHVSQERLNREDPNRLAYNSPVWISDRGPNINRLMTFEVWPPTFIVYQLNFLINLAWPDMRIPSDIPPPFLSVNSIIFGALSQGFATYCPSAKMAMKDPAYSLDNANRYQAMQESSFQDAVNADESRTQTMFTSVPCGDGSLGVNYELNHAYTADGEFLVP